MPKSNYVDFKAVKATVSMLQILDHYGLTERFKRSNDSLCGVCPLHNGENPTQFRVSLSKNCWNCFGQCKRGGNVLDFVALKEGVSLRRAALRISEWFNLSFDTPTSGPKSHAGDGTPRTSRSKSSVRRSRDAAEATGPNKPLGFQLQNLNAGHTYLAERGVSNETVTEFALGFCANGSMSGRIVIPIHNAQGQLVAYAGRWPGAPPDGTPKYKLPAGFRKAQELFNLHRAIQQSSDAPLVLVEGFFDCIKLWQHGIKRVVALMGSTLSSAQEELIRKHTNLQTRVLLMLDEDEAGRAARAQILPRLACFSFAKVHTLNEEGQQPEALTAEEIAGLFGGAP